MPPPSILAVKQLDPSLPAAPRAQITDDGKYWNHCEEPNTGPCPDDVPVGGCAFSSYATRDIAPGEELLDDYGKYEYPGWFLSLYRQFNHSIDYITLKDPTPVPASAALAATSLKKDD